MFKPDCVLWGAWRDGRPVAAITTYVTTDGAVEAVLGGGELQGIKAIKPVLCRWAKEEGAGCVRIIGRKGWARVFGMTRDGEVMELALD